MKDKTISIYLTDKEKKKLSDLAKQNNLTLSAYVRGKLQLLEQNDAQVSEIKRKRVNIKLSKKLLKLVQNSSKKYNKSVSSLVKSVVLLDEKHDQSSAEFVLVNDKLLHGFSYEIYKLGCNINQIAHALNIIKADTNYRIHLDLIDQIEREMSKVSDQIKELDECKSRLEKHKIIYFC